MEILGLAGTICRVTEGRKGGSTLFALRFQQDIGGFWCQTSVFPCLTTFKERSPTPYGTCWEKIGNRVVEFDVGKEILSVWKGGEMDQNRELQDPVGLLGARMHKCGSFQRFSSPSQC